MGALFQNLLKTNGTIRCFSPDNPSLKHILIVFLVPRITGLAGERHG